MQFVYILHCSDGGYYTGCTSNLEQRVLRHNSGYVESTKCRLPVSVVFYASFVDIKKAFEFEHYLKSGSGIAFRNKRLL